LRYKAFNIFNEKHRGYFLSQDTRTLFGYITQQEKIRQEMHGSNRPTS